ncbi:hypothetical protein HID58_064540 [Brassica napus]|uniref:Uncharacterized protein n=1 Tax=Brassica napus TaxID=3708 RepID=A0ABQ7ZAN2_BRANA|nr:hypothetical protein HID58_064540 [Brassica napus]
MFKDFGRRLQRDLKKIVDARVLANNARTGGEITSQPVEVNVVSHPVQKFAVWFGGSVLSSTPEFFASCRTKEEYEECGASICRKTRLKYGMRLYQEVRELSQIAEDNRQLYWFKNKLTKQNKHAKELEESLGILRQSMKMQHAQNKEEEFSSFIEFQEKEMKTFREEREKKMAEMNKRYFENMLDLEREFDVFGAVHDQERLNDADDADD